MKFYGDRAFISNAFQRGRHALLHNRNSSPNEQLVFALGLMFQSMLNAVPHLLCAGP